jgi:endo-1,4-beta-D-glucanase Y
MVKNWNQFIREFIENSDNIIDIKMQEIRTLINGVSDGQNIVYEWENKEDHQLMVNFTKDELSIRYEFDIDDLIVTKIVGDTVDFTNNVQSISDGLSTIEKDIHMVLSI